MAIISMDTQTSKHTTFIGGTRIITETIVCQIKTTSYGTSKSLTCSICGMLEMNNPQVTSCGVPYCCACRSVNSNCTICDSSLSTHTWESILASEIYNESEEQEEENDIESDNDMERESDSENEYR
jgi:hypothetical protein